mmetsp:Transcript_72478/g.160094  ORF Transcript_72478/g.160094 Transcript_72478/m.160094 type:complete len:290 (+) Transcript_72478:38-907(+)
MYCLMAACIATNGQSPSGSHCFCHHITPSPLPTTHAPPTLRVGSAPTPRRDLLPGPKDGHPAGPPVAAASGKTWSLELLQGRGRTPGMQLDLPRFDWPHHPHRHGPPGLVQLVAPPSRSRRGQSVLPPPNPKIDDDLRAWILWALQETLDLEGFPLWLELVLLGTGRWACWGCWSSFGGGRTFPNDHRSLPNRLHHPHHLLGPNPSSDQYHLHRVRRNWSSGAPHWPQLHLPSSGLLPRTPTRARRAGLAFGPCKSMHMRWLPSPPLSSFPCAFLAESLRRGIGKQPPY